MAETIKKQSKPVRNDKEYANELVTVNLFKDNDRYNSDIFVAVNGVGMLVPRGKEVQIPRKYAEVLKNSERQDKYAAKFMSELAEKANDEIR